MNFTIGNLFIILFLSLAVSAGNSNDPADDSELRKELITESYNAFQQLENGKKVTRDPDRIQPYINNPRYWQYKGEPVLLLGGTVMDNLFQIHHLQSHLDSLQDVGGNYIRNTMSDRDQGNQRAFAMTPDGQYDLNQWNEEYWLRFEHMLKLTSERDIIVQIEIWDRFDHSQDHWLTNPYNPGNNSNYTFRESNLDSIYPEPAWRENVQPFFFTVPALNNNETVLEFQKKFVEKILSISLNYDNVLYCIDNETSGTEEWATFWADFIQENAQGKDTYVTQMWDDWDVKSEIHKRTLDHPDRYGYIDISQNSHNTGRLNWDNAQYVFDYIKDDPRPVNSTKIYGNDNFERWLRRGINSEHSIQTFYRNVLGGFASSRFHRPVAGLGLGQPAVNSIKTIRKLEELVKMWEVSPQMDLLRNADENEAYLAAEDGEKYVIYFPKSGNVNLDLSQHPYEFTVRWLVTDDAQWATGDTIQGGDLVELESYGETGSIAVILKK